MFMFLVVCARRLADGLYLGFVSFVFCNFMRFVFWNLDFYKV